MGAWLLLMTMASVLAIALSAVSARVSAAPVYSVPCEYHVRTYRSHSGRVATTAQFAGVPLMLFLLAFFGQTANVHAVVYSLSLPRSCALWKPRCCHKFGITKCLLLCPHPIADCGPPGGAKASVVANQKWWSTMLETRASVTSGPYHDGFCNTSEGNLFADNSWASKQ